MWQAIASFILGNNRRGNQQDPQQFHPGQDNLGHLGSSQFQLPTQQGPARNSNLLGSFVKNIFGSQEVDDE